MMMLERPVCERWFEHNPQFAGQEQTSMGTFGAWVPLPSFQKRANFAYIL